jgi:hypothetical protein
LDEQYTDWKLNLTFGGTLPSFSPTKLKASYHTPTRRSAGRGFQLFNYRVKDIVGLGFEIVAVHMHRV